MTRTRICFVCWGNICRSPTAEGIMRSLVEAAGRTDIEVDSAATSREELGNPVDPRTAREAAGRGITLSHRAWRFEAHDFDRFDLVIAVDDVNLERLHARARSDDDTAKLRRLRTFDPAYDAANDPWGGDVPDPWYGGHDGFVLVYDLIEAACKGLLATL